ncbi:mitochondrial 54S ribosomal protein mL38 [Aspergillus clavatus NRRL 1]|uniref:Large ribosomal subunit protein mL38 n=1 Tax=Aspergillus clavatus (strain ATCC 1007 / CBS 513.65 / DSM 816 / NCTC 3887 / NRRL 1 / QM 1276 / 107) TaxID=344612 RepID=A1CBM6_ASPCL|nr:mitochondrial 54S ribosomal protein YmL35 [Aspergillus clavatus NRRL 1]EAW13144.1 mitochondrial large ribosomal subunit YmL35, putative [Aspergillus clavatus NRRL 1]
MAPCKRASKPLLQCLQRQYTRGSTGLQLQSTRAFQSTSLAREEAQTDANSQPFYKNPDPALVSSPRLERKLLKQGIAPVGSRRRRAALQNSDNIPFEQLPYQCFQEARKVLLSDREEKVKKITAMREKIARLQVIPTEEAGGEQVQKSKLRAMELELERLKIGADINDPIVKKKFEDGQGDMTKPIYRYLADRKWREYRRKILVQRITQMKVIPDVLPHCDPVVDIKLHFGRHTIQPGEFVNSRVSTTAPKLDVQLFEAGEKLVTIAVVDSDVPNVEKDEFDYKMHYLAVNVPISATSTKVDLANLSADSQVILPWLPPVAQKGSPYHRLSIFIMEQKDSAPLNVASVKALENNRDVLLRTLQARYHLKAIGAYLFRTQWDETMADVMREIGFADADMELRRKRVEPLPYKRRNPSTFR